MVKDVTILVLSYNREERAEEIVDWFKNTCTYKNCDLLVVDDHSDKAYSLDCNVLRHPENYPVPKARNEAIMTVKTPYLLMLDDDITLLNKNCIEMCLKKIYSDRKIGLVFPKKNDYDGKSMKEYSVFLASPWTGNLIQIEGDGVCGNVPFGCQVAFGRTEVFKLGYDESFGWNPFRGKGYSFREESSFHARARAAGWKLEYLPEFQVMHDLRRPGGAVKDKGTLKNLNYWHCYANVLFVRRYLTLGWLRAVFWSPYVLAHSVHKGLSTLPSGIKGYVDGWRL